jgi:hypothetical protein
MVVPEGVSPNGVNRSGSPERIPTSGSRKYGTPRVVPEVRTQKKALNEGPQGAAGGPGVGSLRGPRGFLHWSPGVFHQGVPPGFIPQARPPVGVTKGFPQAGSTRVFPQAVSTKRNSQGVIMGAANGDIKSRAHKRVHRCGPSMEAAKRGTSRVVPINCPLLVAQRLCPTSVDHKLGPQSGVLKMGSPRERRRIGFHEGGPKMAPNVVHSGLYPIGLPQVVPLLRTPKGGPYMWSRLEVPYCGYPMGTPSRSHKVVSDFFLAEDGPQGFSDAYWRMWHPPNSGPMGIVPNCGTPSCVPLRVSETGSHNKDQKLMYRKGFPKGRPRSGFRQPQFPNMSSRRGVPRNLSTKGFPRNGSPIWGTPLVFSEGYPNGRSPRKIEPSGVPLGVLQ